MIKQEDIDKIFEAARVEEVINDFVDLKKRGVNYVGLCPFHNEKTPSFTVSPAKEIYKCFGCGAAGNAVNFIMEHEHYSYPEALKYLAEKYNIEIQEEEKSAEQIREDNERESLFLVTKFAAEYFQKTLHNTEEGKAVGLSYFKERGFRDEIIEKFQLGYSPDKWEAFTQKALDEGYKQDYLEKTGLTIVKGEKKFDRFKGRVIFPIHNLTGRVIGFGGRILKNDKKAAKYLNSPESEIYHKSKVLYGIYFARQPIRKLDNCYLVEGYTDVISLFQSGVENVVASSGTSLTEGQIRQINRYTNNITVLFDGDPAGIKASFRSIDMILEQGMNVRIVAFPEGEDPDSYASEHSSTELKTFLEEEATDFIRFKTKILQKDAGDDPVKRSSMIRDVLTSVAAIPDRIQRQVYTKECSALLDMDEEILVNELNKLRRKKLNDDKKRRPAKEREPQDILPTQKKPGKKRTAAAKRTEFQEKDVIRLLLNYGTNTIQLESAEEEEGEEKEMIDVPIAEFMVSEIAQDGIQFDHPVYKQIFNAYLEALEEGKLLDDKFFLQHDDEEVRKACIDIVSSPYHLSESWETKHQIPVTTEEMLLRQAIFGAVYSLKLHKVNELIKANQGQLKEAHEDDLHELMKEQAMLQDFKKAIADKLGRIVIY